MSWLLSLCLVLLSATLARADGPFDGGWTLDPGGSVLALQSVKNDVVVESSGFAALKGTISAAGEAHLAVQLDSIDTKIDLRNVRMRFLFFETFNFPEAHARLTLDAAQVADLAKVRRKHVTLPFELELHGQRKMMEARVSMILLDDQRVAVSSVLPVPVSVADFGLTPGLEKLQEAANVRILPSGTITFDLLFTRGEIAAPAPVIAQESQGNLNTDECAARFAVLSRSRAVTFRSASARIDAASGAFLDTLLDVVNRCPDLVIEIGGHTDSDGRAADNQALSDRRARAVADHLIAKGIPTTRLLTKGFGDTVPLAENTTAAGKARNRRIEFVIKG